MAHQSQVELMTKLYWDTLTCQIIFSKYGNNWKAIELNRCELW